MYVPKWILFPVLMMAVPLSLIAGERLITRPPRPEPLPAACAEQDTLMLWKCANGEVWLREAPPAGGAPPRWRKLRTEEFTKNFGVFRPQ